MNANLVCEHLWAALAEITGGMSSCARAAGTHNKEAVREYEMLRVASQDIYQALDLAMTLAKRGAQ